jgi:tyrosinase
MRSSILFLTASTVSAGLIPNIVLPTATNLPASAFPSFKTLSLEDAIKGIDLLVDEVVEPVLGSLLEHNETHSSFSEELAKPTVLSEAATACAANPNMRYEWNSYKTADRVNFVNSIKCLINKPASGNFPPATNRFEDLARLHQMYMPNIHGNAKFLVWHRYFLWTFEQVLRDECGLTAAFPWFDETLHAGAFSSSDIFSTSYFGLLGGPDSNGNPKCVTTGAFAGLTAHIGPGSSNTAHCLSRGGNAQLTAQCNSNYVNTCNARTSYSDMESCSEGGSVPYSIAEFDIGIYVLTLPRPHAYGHNGIGGVMADVSASPSDPFFYMHHSSVDHSFRIWQNADVSSRTTSINGVDHNGVALTMNTPVYMGGIMPDITIGDIMNTESGAIIGGKTFCYRYNY